MQQRVRVLVVDDSAFMRRVISELLASDPGIEVVGIARDGEDALEKMRRLMPDVITLDVEMPRLDGFGALRAIMQERPTPVVMVSSHTREGAEATVHALTMGAVDFVTKPSGSISLNMSITRDELVAKVKAAAGATVRVRRFPVDMKTGGPPPITPSPAAPVASPVFQQAAAAAQEARLPLTGGLPRQLVLIGCSTGGPGALHQIIPHLPGDLPAAVVVVQHMPAGFTRSLANRLNDLSPLQVREAADGDRVEVGTVLVAPGGRHLLLTPEGRVTLNDDPPMHGVRPAVDKCFESAVPIWGDRMIGVILTGMGYDGAKGMVALKKAGGRTVAEDQSTCVVYGMPKVVVEMGAADEVLPVDEISAAIVRLCHAAHGARERGGTSA